MDSFINILSKFWLSPEEMVDLVVKDIEKHTKNNSLKVIVSGETENISLYILDKNDVFIFSPFTPIENNVLLNEIYDKKKLPLNINSYIFPLDNKILNRLKMPKVLLVNPCVNENFPIPRLCLSVGILAGYLRKYQKAEVRIIDMQMNFTLSDVEKFVELFSPYLIAISISFGQKDLAISILEKVYKNKFSNKKPLIVLGNVIPASYPQEFLDLYPNILISRGEGEITLLKLIDYIKGKCKLSEVPGIVYLNETNIIKRTENSSVSMSDIPLPALDTIKSISYLRGALTLELSRGCQWNSCSICPREHKSSLWKTYNPEEVSRLFYLIHKVCEEFNLEKHIFLADEEFIGDTSNEETERIQNICNILINNKYHLKYDASTRVDQIYTPNKDNEWHIKRVEMWHFCKKSGLEKLFVGIESGSDNQLKRYNKGIKKSDSVIAIRILTALGISPRFGFITFDPLMQGFNDLKENIEFLSRTDAFIKKIDVEKYGYNKLFHLLQDERFVEANKMGIPIYAGVSYMLASLEVLINSHYVEMIREVEQNKRKMLISNDVPDINMCRYKTKYLDEFIQDISVSTQKWIDRNFAVAYCVKSLHKVAPPSEKKILMNWMITYRMISLFLLRALIYIFDESDDESIIVPLENLHIINSIRNLRLKYKHDKSLNRLTLILKCMDIFEDLVKKQNDEIFNLLEIGMVSDNSNKNLYTVLHTWENNMGIWKLING